MVVTCVVISKVKKIFSQRLPKRLVLEKLYTSVKSSTRFSHIETNIFVSDKFFQVISLSSPLPSFQVVVAFQGQPWQF